MAQPGVGPASTASSATPLARAGAAARSRVSPAPVAAKPAARAARAVETMRCYIHKECPAPGPHDARPGRRAFGWLCRTLLKRPSPCGCASCKALAARLAPTLGAGGDSDDDDDDVSFAAGARAWLRRATPPGGRVAAAARAHRGAVDAALVCGEARSAALLRPLQADRAPDQGAPAHALGPLNGALYITGESLVGGFI